MRLARVSRARFTGVVLVGLTVTLAVVVAAARATAESQTYYLALGDSMTYGFQPAKAGRPPSAFDSGFVDVVAARLRKGSPELRVVNYGCPGESTVTFTRGHCPAFADHLKLHDAFRGSQLDAARAFLQAHSGDVALVTLTLYGNDWLPVLLDVCKGKAACARSHGPKESAAFGSRLASIIRQLRAAAPTAEIVVTGAWNPDPSQLAALVPTYRSFEASVVRAAVPSHARVAKMLPVFNPPTKAQARLCAFTFICSKGDPHPTDAGYRAMADAVLRAAR